MFICERLKKLQSSFKITVLLNKYPYKILRATWGCCDLSSQEISSCFLKNNIDAGYYLKQYQTSISTYYLLLKISQIAHHDAIWIQLFSETHKHHLEFEVYQKIVLQCWFISKPHILYILYNCADTVFCRMWCREISFKLVRYLVWLKAWQSLLFWNIWLNTVVSLSILRIILQVVSL